MPYILTSLLFLLAPTLDLTPTLGVAPAHDEGATTRIADDVKPVEFATLAGFDWQEGRELPAAVRALNGKKIGITGFVRSFDGSDDDISGFWLVDQNCDCEGIPRMNEVIVCWMPEGKTISNDGSPIRVTGKFEVGEQKDGDYVTSIYRLNIEVAD